MPISKFSGSNLGEAYGRKSGSCMVMRMRGWIDRFVMSGRNNLMGGVSSTYHSGKVQSRDRFGNVSLIFFSHSGQQV
jgi:hypothetical protein